MLVDVAYTNQQKSNHTRASARTVIVNVLTGIRVGRLTVVAVGHVLRREFAFDAAAADVDETQPVNFRVHAGTDAPNTDRSIRRKPHPTCGLRPITTTGHSSDRRTGDARFVNQTGHDLGHKSQATPSIRWHRLCV